MTNFSKQKMSKKGGEVPKGEASVSKIKVYKKSSPPPLISKRFTF